MFSFKGLFTRNVPSKSLSEFNIVSMVMVSLTDRMDEQSIFEFFTNYTNMSILAFSSLLHENKKIQLQNVTPQWE